MLVEKTKTLKDPATDSQTRQEIMDATAIYHSLGAKLDVAIADLEESVDSSTPVFKAKFESIVLELEKN